MAEAKDTIYIDVDEEITGIVNKVASSSKSIVALVLPKRAAVLQSIVNMKLLKKTADTNDKQVVLITSEPRLLPLAGAAKLFVAPNLTSKPYIPPAPSIDEGPAQDTADGEVAVDPKTPLSEVAPDAKFADDEAVEIDNTAKKPEPGDASAKANKSGKKKIPNFAGFRKKLIFGGLALILIAGFLFWALAIAPKAAITLKTQSDEVPTEFAFVADPNSTDFDEENKIVPAQNKEVEKNDSEKVATTGEKNLGNKASGTVTLKNCTKTAGQVTIPAGTGVSSGDHTYLTQQAVTLPASIFTGTDACITSTKDVPVLAQEPGAEHNLSPRDYTVAGRNGINASGSEMAGGTDKKVKVVSQKDIETAKERLSSKQNSVQDEMKQQFEDAGFVAIGETFKASAANYNPSPGVDSEATEVTVSVTTKYTMLGVKKDDLKKLIEKEVKTDDANKQRTILEDGIAKATFKTDRQPGGLEKGQLSIDFQTTVVVGPDINQEDLKNELAGKRKGAAEDLLRGRPGIIEPKVELSPFWVAEIPGKADKVTFEIQQPDGTKIEQ